MVTIVLIALIVSATVALRCGVAKPLTRHCAVFLAGQKIALAISCGSEEQQYSAQAKYRYRLAELLLPFV